MTPSEATSLAQNAVLISLILAAPILMVGMAVGLLISLFQAVTQIQEMTLTFVPKIIAVMFTSLYLSSWMVTKLVDYTRDLIMSLPNIVR